MSTNEYIRNVKIGNYLSFNTRLWQRNYYEHVIRNESELTRTREYIANNPIRWNEGKIAGAHLCVYGEN